jgi:DNA-binding transcriptional MerR regulator
MMALSTQGLSIKEFSLTVGIKQSVLRYYDEIDLFKPSGRGENNYRYYTLDQIQIIKLIETLRGLRVPLKQIKQQLDERDPDQMLLLLSNQEARLNRELKLLQESFTLIHTLRLLIQGSIPDDEKRIEVRFNESSRISLGPLNHFLEGEDYHRVFSEFYQHALERNMNISYPIGGYFDSFEEFLASPSRPKRYFLLDPDGKDIRPAGSYLVAYHRGDYGEMGNLPERLAAYVQENNVVLTGPVYQVYPISELYTKDSDDYLLRTTILLK